MKSSDGTSPLCDQFYFDTDKITSLPAGRCVLIYFITGNPGLIEYYRHFLAQLHGRLGLEDRDTRYLVYGRSLAGFALARSGVDSFANGPPYSLDEQLNHVRHELCEQILAVYPDLPHVQQDGTLRSLEVVLIGHSVGSFIALETLDWWQRLIPRLQEQSDAVFDGERGRALQNALHNTRISAGICLFPTVVDIALSPMGKMLTPLFRLSHFAPFVHFLVKFLFALTPSFALAMLIRIVLRMPKHPASVTAAFLKSSMGVYQALYMSRDEMNQIGPDKWSDDFWGSDMANADMIAKESAGAATTAASRRPHQRPKLFFYWGGDDHWVANTTRDAVIARRARTGKERDGEKPHMEIDSMGIPHAFCIRDSVPVANKVADFILSLEPS